MRLTLGHKSCRQAKFEPFTFFRTYYFNCQADLPATKENIQNSCKYKYLIYVVIIQYNIQMEIIINKDWWNCPCYIPDVILSDSIFTQFSFSIYNTQVTFNHYWGENSPKFTAEICENISLENPGVALSQAAASGQLNGGWYTPDRPATQNRRPTGPDISRQIMIPHNFITYQQP